MLRRCCSGSKVPEFMISCEYIRILKYCMYISTTERRLPFINYSEWHKNEGCWRRQERGINPVFRVPNLSQFTSLCSGFIPKYQQIQFRLHEPKCKYTIKEVSQKSVDAVKNWSASATLSTCWKKQLVSGVKTDWETQAPQFPSTAQTSSLCGQEIMDRAFKDGLNLGNFGMKASICSKLLRPPAQWNNLWLNTRRSPVLVAVVGRKPPKLFSSHKLRSISEVRKGVFKDPKFTRRTHLT